MSRIRNERSVVRAVELMKEARALPVGVTRTQDVQIAATFPCTFRCLAPSIFANAIGEDGSTTKRAIWELTGCRVEITCVEDCFPNTSGRVLIVHGASWEALGNAVHIIIQRLSEAVSASRLDAKLQIVVPQHVAAVLASGCANLTIMQKSFGLHLDIDSMVYGGRGPGADQLINVTCNTQLGLMGAVTEVLSCLKECSVLPWFLEWARRSNKERLTEPEPPSNGRAKVRKTEIGGISAGNAGPGNAGCIDLHAGEGWLGSGIEGSGADVLLQVLKMIPPQVSQEPRGFSLSCSVPDRLAGGLIGRSGSVVKEIREATGAKIDIPPNPAHPDFRRMNVAGPLFGCVAAYISMMKQYVEVETTQAQSAATIATSLGMGVGTVGPALNCTGISVSGPQASSQTNQY